MIEVISEEAFGHAALARHPVWSEYYDFEKIEEVAGWGVNREWLASELAFKGNGSKHPYYSIPIEKLPVTRMRIYFAASFVTKGGAQLKGWILQNGFVIGIHLSPDENAVFSRHPQLEKFNDKELGKLVSFLKINPEEVFPLSIVLDARLPDIVHSQTFSPALPRSQW
ncbi:hypothetical protein [Leptospira sp. P2653]|uniref:hypothetical protein n=1 Tax=Leptospira sp. P2653 TaxID=1218600 RepID=UPI0002BF6B1B|nr:hypothetical protein [Leptospira sp. P2653]EMJ67204.1 hypothetical protein LEP1GSC051_0877 [Leptospira sp. P2653]